MEPWKRARHARQDQVESAPEVDERASSDNLLLADAPNEADTAIKPGGKAEAKQIKPAGKAETKQIRPGGKGKARPKKPSIIRWGGLLGGVDLRLRAVVFVSIIVAVLSLSFMQFGFLGIGAPGHYVTYAVTMFAPIALAALLLGMIPGTVMGVVAGVVMYLHAILQPLDYYELNFVTPFSSVGLLGLSGLIVGFFVALALRKEPPVWKGILRIGVVFLGVSAVYSMGFFLNVIVQLLLQMVAHVETTGQELTEAQLQHGIIVIAGRLGDMGLQVFVDAAIMLFVCIVAGAVVQWFKKTHDNRSLRTTFRIWLFCAVAIVFLATSGTGFVAITEQSKASAEKAMNSQINYLNEQLEAYDQRIAALSAFAAESGVNLSEQSKEAQESLQKAVSIDNLLQGYAADVDSTILIARDGKVLLSNNDNYKPNDSVETILDGDVSFESVLDSGRMEQIAYDEDEYQLMQSISSELTPEEVLAFSDRPITTQMAYVCAGSYADYDIYAIATASEVFAERTSTMAWVSLTAFVLLLTVFLIASRLLTRIVVRNIDKTNDVLTQITHGDLNAQVSIDDSREFRSLSLGVNTMVDALKGWISEAETRMDAELATAKAIQESALPRTFPPFPSIQRFDIYASMNAAREVGGDFYDFFLIGEDSNAPEDARDDEPGKTGKGSKLGFVIADVSGKGVPAALFMMTAKTLVRDYMLSGMELGEAVENANCQLCDGNDAGMFVTLFAGILDYETGHATYVNAGHNPPLLWHDGTWRWLRDISGMPLGLFDGFGYDAFEADCTIGDTLFAYTDGVTEAMSVEGELFGEDRLQEVLERNFDQHPRLLVEAVRQAVAKHAEGAEQSDDITTLALEAGVPPELTAVLVVPADIDELTRVNEFVHAELDRRLCPVRAQKQLDIAVEELFVNVCRYAYPESTPENPGTVRVSYTYAAEPPSITVDLIDDGIPYDPLAKPDAEIPDDIEQIPIGGLGIFMAKNSVDEMCYERSGKSNMVTLVKRW